MNNVYGEPVEVRTRADGRPVRFVWRSRVYAVRAILEHWVINREWWRDPGPETGTGAGEPELEFWRVEAGIACEVYELRRDAATDAWTIRMN